MSLQNFLNYDNYIQLQNKNLEIWGQSCTMYVPENITALGYENTSVKDTEKMGAQQILSNKYRKYEGRIWINFTITKNVMYKFNYFPEDAEEQSMAFMTSNSFIRENCYIRTSVPGQTSIWGDMIFQVVKVQDVGLAKTLQRIYFLKPTSNMELYNLLTLGNAESITGTKRKDKVIIHDNVKYANDYNDLVNKPSINGVTLEGDKTQNELIDINDKYTDSGVTVDVGGIKKGDKFNNEDVKNILDKMFHPYQKPELSVTTDINRSTYGVGETVSRIKFTIDYKKVSKDIISVTLLRDGTPIYIPEVKPEGGHVEYTYIPQTAISSSTTFSVEVKDGSETITWSLKLNWYNYSYIGTVDKLYDPEILIDKLTKVLNTSATYTAKNLTIDYGKVVYIYPASFGKLSSITDNKSKWDITNSFTLSYIDINGVNYAMYYLTDNAGFTNSEIIFKS